VSEYTAHLSSDEKPDYTACGEPWQGWQAPHTDSYELTPGNVELPPHDEPRPHRDRTRQCQACLKVAVAQLPDSEGQGNALS
jgi:hypothetical protein